MPFHVRSAGALTGLRAGETVVFTLVVDKKSSWVEDLRVVAFDSAERDPMQASRLKLLESVTGEGSPAALNIGDKVPGFSLIDQNGRQTALADFSGKVIAINFIYTRCPLPDYCFRLSNNFGRLQKRFAGNRDLVLLTVTFDPVHDQPDVLARYAEIWKADPTMWHFLTGQVNEVQRVCDLFGVGHWQEEGVFTHSLHTGIIDREGRLAANIEGNRFTAQQLGDLVDSVLKRTRQ